MRLTKNNFDLFAAQYYDNPNCLSKEDFYEDLKLLSTIKRLISKYLNGEDINIKLLTNNIITFYNVFEHHAATMIFEFKMDRQQFPVINSILAFLSLPVINNYIDLEFYNLLCEEFR